MYQNHPTQYASDRTEYQLLDGVVGRIQRQRLRAEPSLGEHGVFAGEQIEDVVTTAVLKYSPPHIVEEIANKYGFVTNIVSIDAAKAVPKQSPLEEKADTYASASQENAA
jgi:hypothetical protein